MCDATHLAVNSVNEATPLVSENGKIKLIKIIKNLFPNIRGSKTKFYCITLMSASQPNTENYLELFHVDNDEK